jgi:hypothetical protein
LVTGAENYVYNALVIANAELKTGASFSGWYKNGILVSTLQHYQFNILAYTELEARTSTNSDEYELKVNPDLAIVIGQGGVIQCSLISLKNGEFKSVSYSFNSGWMQRIIYFDKTVFDISVIKNNTGTARNGILTITQSKSGKKVYVNVQQQAVAPDAEYEWVLNQSDLIAATNSNTPSTGEYTWVYEGVHSWSPYAPPSTATEPCTEEDYKSGRKLKLQYYTVILKYKVPNVTFHRYIQVEKIPI